MTSPKGGCKAAALAYAAKGWFVFPCVPRGKNPLTPHGYKDASRDPEQIERWWNKHPNANVGLPCGENGLIVIDLDGGVGYANWNHLCDDLDIDAATASSRTGGGGYHLFYRAPAGVVIRNSAGKVAEGIDVRANGGYVVVSPSVHKSGRAYKWIMPPDEIKPLPEALQSLLSKGKRKVSEPVRASGRFTYSSYAQAALEGEVANVHSAPRRTRNDTLNRAAFALGQLIATNELDRADVETRLHEAAVACGYVADDGERSALATIRSGIEAGLREPRETNVGRRNKPNASATPKATVEGEPATLQRDRLHLENALRFLRDTFRWVTSHNRWLRWKGTVWQQCDEPEVALAMSNFLVEVYSKRLAAAHSESERRDWARLVTEACTTARILGAVAFAKGHADILVRPEQLDANGWLLNCLNGVIDLRSLSVREHQREDLCTKVAPVVCDPEADPTVWERHLQRFLPSPNIRRYLQRSLGMALVGAVLDETLDIWWGTGQNGKTTTARVIMSALGGYAKRGAPKLLVATKHDRHPTELADLAGSRLVFSVEVDEGCRLAEALVKDLTGGDTKKARFLFGDFFEFSQVFSIILLVNHKLTVRGQDTGIWRRLRLVPWTEQITPTERRPQDEVVEELAHRHGSAVLNWLLEGLADWKADRQWIAPEVVAATEQYREEQDALGGFLGECCELGDRYRAPKGDFYERYSTWAQDAGEEPLTKRLVADALRTRGITSQRDMNTRYWCGVRLKSP